ncbi:MAG TPA: endonuclease V [Micromonosporaceae bacterium]|jgi:deoxyribonuclease V
MRGKRYGAVDVHYPAGSGAWAALAVAEEPTFARVSATYTGWLGEVAPYQPGRFYLRELPVIRAVLADAGIARGLGLLVVDGYVDLDPGGSPGLGAHLYGDQGFPVVGVAKTRFRGADHAIAVRRGGADRPLYVTAVGMPIHDAAAMVAAMAGTSRLPDVLRLVDRLARTAEVSAGRGGLCR